MKKTAFQTYFRLVNLFILITLVAFIYASEVSGKTYAYIVADARDGKILKSHN